MLVKFDFLLIVLVVGIIFTISLPTAYSEIQSRSNHILQGDGTFIQKQTQYSKNQVLATDKTDSITKNVVPVTKIILVTKYSDHVRISYSFFINAKVYYANQNPSGNFDQYYGFIPNAKLTVQILDPNGVLVKSFTGITDNHGYYYQTFRIPDNSRIGTYAVLVSAQMGDSIDSKKLPLFIQPHRQS